MNIYQFSEGLITEDKALLHSVITAFASRTSQTQTNRSLELYLILKALDRHLVSCGVDIVLSIDMLNLNMTNHHGDTVLHHAARASHDQSHRSLLQVLLAAGGGVCDIIDQQNMRGFTPLHSAVYFNNLEAAHILIVKGANTISVFDEDDKLPVAHAVTSEMKKLLRVAMSWSHRKHFVLFLTSYAFLVRKDGSSIPGELQEAAQADADVASSFVELACVAAEGEGNSDGEHHYSGGGSLLLRQNAVHRVFDIEDLDRFICSFL